MKIRKDPGLEYVQSLNLRPAKNKREFMEYLVRTIGSEQSTAIFEELDRRASGVMNEEYFYTLKNSDLKTSMAFSGSLDGDIIRRACNWIADHKDLFGKTILDVGCDCGIMSCFLAKTFPDSKILSIDVADAALDNARELAEKLGLENITFEKKDVRKLLLGDKYDTVFSMRTLIGNLTISGQEDTTWELEEAGRYFARSSRDFARALEQAVAANGTLISIEKIDKNGFLLGWLQAIENTGLRFDVDAHEEIPVKELALNSVMQAIAARRDGEPVKAIDFFVDMYSTLTAFDRANYEDWMAKTAVYLKAGSLIRGIKTIDDEKGVHTKTALYSYKDDASLLMLAQYIGEIFQVSLFERENQKQIIDNIKQIEESEKERQGVRIIPLS